MKDKEEKKCIVVSKGRRCASKATKKVYINFLGGTPPVGCYLCKEHFSELKDGEAYNVNKKIGFLVKKLVHKRKREKA